MDVEPDQRGQGCDSGRNKGRSCRGVTLLELSIALAVMAVLATLAVPVMDKRMARQRLVTAAESLLADLSEARFVAARERYTVTLVAQAGPAWRWQVLATSAGAGAAGTNAAGPSVLSTTLHSSHPGVRMTQGGAAHLQGDGGAQTVTVAVFESLHGQRLQVDVLALGRGRICQPNSATVPATGLSLHRYAPC